jgi:CRP/FNR family transcriptional regulator
MAGISSKSPVDLTDLLRRLPFFNGLTDRDLNDFLTHAVRKHFERGAPILWEGDPPGWLYIVISGRVKVSRQSPAGKPITLSYFTSGEMVGEVAVFENIPYPASAEAVVTCELLAISRADALAYVARHAPAARALLTILGERLRHSQDRLRGFAGERAEQRLAGALLMLFEKMGPDLPFCRQDIADLAGTTLETAIRVLSRLTKGGIIRSSRGHIKITDSCRLELLSQGPPGFPPV